MQKVFKGCYLCLLLLLCARPQAQSQTIAQYQYWFDGNYAAAQSGPASGVHFTLNTALSAASLPPGLHEATFRARDANGKWSAPVSFAFLKPAKITAYEYWFDTAYHAAVPQTIAAATTQYILLSSFPTGALSYGLHTLNIRMKDEAGRWSAPVSAPFLKPADLLAYEYWYDTAYSAAALRPLSSAAPHYLLTDTFATGVLPYGLHSLNIRMKDAAGRWSAPVSVSFFKKAALSAFEYWIDNDYAGRPPATPLSDTIVYISNPVAPTGLDGAVHRLHFRCRDASGRWSSVAQAWFVQQRRIVAYRYWFNSNLAGAATTTLSAPTAVLEINPQNLQINVLSQPYAARDTMHLQFLDNTGQWSIATSDTFRRCTVCNGAQIFPSLTLSRGSLFQNQNTTIFGADFTPYKSALVNVAAANGASVFSQYAMADAAGRFAVNWLPAASMVAGIYKISATDTARRLTTEPANQALLRDGAQLQSATLSITSPTVQDEYELNAGPIAIQFTDYANPGAFATGLSAFVSRSYGVEYSLNGGAFMPATVSGTNALLRYSAFINIQSIDFTPPSAGSYRIRMYGQGNAANADTSDVFLVQNPAANTFRVARVWDRSAMLSTRPVLGAVADGVARFYFKIAESASSGKTIQKVDVALSDIGGTQQNTRLLGKVAPARITNAYTLEANSANSLAAQQPNPDNSGAFWLWYVAPNDFMRDSASDYFSGKRFVKASFLITYTNGTTATQNERIEIVRPPLMLVHGLNSDADAWKDTRFGRGQNEIYFKDATTLFPAGIHVNTMYKERAFKENAKLLLGIKADNVGNLTPDVTEESFPDMVEKARYNGYACNRVDYVCHSMGGSDLRTAVNVYGDFYNPTPADNRMLVKNYDSGFVNKAITLNTPHNGSCAADVLQEYLPRMPGVVNDMINVIYRLSSAIDGIVTEERDVARQSFIPGGRYYKYSATPAVSNLQSFNDNSVDGGVRFSATPVRNHLVAGEVVNNTNSGIQFLADNPDLALLKLVVLLSKHVAHLNTGAAIAFDMLDGGADIAHDAVNWMMNRHGSPNFMETSDIVVPLPSQLAGKARASLGLTGKVFTGFNKHHLGITADRQVGDWVYKVLNQSVFSGYFAPTFPANNAPSGLRYKSTVNPDSTKEYADTLKAVLLPLSSGHCQVDSFISVKIKLKDTAHLKSLLVGFQGDIYASTLKADTVTFKLRVKSIALDTQVITSVAVYDSSGFSLLRYDSKIVVVDVDTTLSGIRLDDDVITVNRRDAFRPSLKGVHSNYLSSIFLNNPSLNIQVLDTTVAVFDKFAGRFISKDSGSTRVVFTYKTYQDTLYVYIVKSGQYSNIPVPSEVHTPSVISSIFTVSPNPASNLLYVTWDGSAVRSGVLFLTNMEGRQLIQKTLSGNGTAFSRMEIDVSALIPGTYLITLQSEDGKQETCKVIIQK